MGLSLPDGAAWAVTQDRMPKTYKASSGQGVKIPLVEGLAVLSECVSMDLKGSVNLPPDQQRNGFTGGAETKMPVVLSQLCHWHRSTVLPFWSRMQGDRDLASKSIPQ
jgi:hypothetical protein